MKIPKSGGQLTVSASQLRELLQTSAKRNEDTVEREIVTALTALGFIVLHTGTRGVRGPTGASKGVPDLIAFIPGCAFSFGLEVKRNEKAPRKPEQIEMNRNGCYPFVWNTEMAVEFLYEQIGVFINGFGNPYIYFPKSLFVCFDRCAGYLHGAKP